MNSAGGRPGEAGGWVVGRGGALSLGSGSRWPAGARSESKRRLGWPLASHLAPGRVMAGSRVGPVSSSSDSESRTRTAPGY